MEEVISVRPGLKLLRFFKRFILYLCNKLFNLLARYKFTRKLLSKNISVKSINFLLKYLLGSSSIINMNQIENKAIHLHNKYKNHHHEESNPYKLNNELLLHYKNSNTAKKYKDLLENNLFSKK